MSADTTTIKRLFGISCNECAHPECEQKLVEVDTLTSEAVVYAEIAHIHGQKPGAERFSQKIFEDKATLDGFDNLLLLCAKHHKQIDEKGAGEIYTADVVRGWKSSHILKFSAEADREWVFGGQTINYSYEGIPYSLSYWITEAGELRFHSEEQLVQTNAARDLSMFIGQLNSLLNIFEDITGEPADPSHQTQNDGYIRILKNNAEALKSSWSGSTPDGGYESTLHRLYENLSRCPDITLAELAELGTKTREMKTTILVGEVTPERIVEAIEDVKQRAEPKER